MTGGVTSADAPPSFRCKLFYKKDAEFKEKGVGTLHLKVTEHGKTQLIIRADTNLGNHSGRGLGAHLRRHLTNQEGAAAG